jgi:predicted nucleic acid-binding protein
LSDPDWLLDAIGNVPGVRAELDLLIAATAVHHDLILMTRNVRHFARIPELRPHEAS